MSYKYPEIKKILMNHIHDKIYQEGQMLPPERELTAMFNVSRMTVRRALEELINDGILIRKKGSGVIVASKKESRSRDKSSFKTDQSLIEKYGTIETKVLELKTIQDHPIASRIFKDYHGEIYQLKRVQSGQGKPIVYENIFFKKDYFKDIYAVDCSQSMLEVTKLISKVEINNEDIMIDARIASKKIASLLQIRVDSPILQVTRIQKHDNDIIFFGIDCMDGNEFNFQVHNDLKGTL